MDDFGIYECDVDSVEDTDGCGRPALDKPDRMSRFVRILFSRRTFEVGVC